MTTVTLSERTIAVMSHLAKINQSLVVDEEVDRNQIRSINAARSLMVFASIPEQLPSFSIYNAKEFLDCVDALTTKESYPDLEFEETFVTIRNGNSSIKYHFCDHNVIRPSLDKWPKQAKAIAPDCRFNLTKTQLDKATKISSTMGLGMYVFETQEGQVTIRAVGEKDSGISHVFKDQIGECEGELTSEFGIFANLMQLFPADYDVVLVEKGLSIFSGQLNDDYSLTYYITPEEYAGRDS